MKKKKERKKEKRGLHPKKLDWGKLIQKCHIHRVTSTKRLRTYIWEVMIYCVFLAIEIAF